jgi:hypothetical protein
VLYTLSLREGRSEVKWLFMQLLAKIRDEF